MIIRMMIIPHRESEEALREVMDAIIAAVASASVVVAVLEEDPSLRSDESAQ